MWKMHHFKNWRLYNYKNFLDFNIHYFMKNKNVYNSSLWIELLFLMDSIWYHAEWSGHQKMKVNIHFAVLDKLKFELQSRCSSYKLIFERCKFIVNIYE